jgi:hypothetical protein
VSAAARILPMPPAIAPAARPGLLVVSNVAHILSPSQVAEYLDSSARWYYHPAVQEATRRGEVLPRRSSNSMQPETLRVLA